MPVFPTWDPSQSVGNSVLDEQHKMLLELVRQAIWLALPDNNTSSRNKIYRILNDIAELARSHFETEERILATNGFPGLAEHKAEHQRHLDLLVEILDGNVQESVDLKSMSKLIAENIYDHLKKTDMECEDYLGHDKRRIAN
jgi:hemerythrin